ncbi:hypothetical protein PJIAN_4497 [Paludibacter jiangxiensis]|uniref:Uncharacterized protein n=1 Tax=Paludibacter jiangxiensis TaxID=681398 RepID=A0A161L973_9BACT|nr:hypothetical protein PJIAN_4497 [Paludibacter jiangxiensis]
MAFFSFDMLKLSHALPAAGLPFWRKKKAKNIDEKNSFARP